MSKANSEQKLAIEHFGGVLLKAGAGSGKTFVLVEHLVYLTQNWIDNYRIDSHISFEDYIRNEFSQVVMMTFTNKAAGEMTIRLLERFTEIAQETSDPKWQVVLDSLPVLNVTTIDGFCLKLITGGYFPWLSSEAKIIFKTERLDQIKILFDQWFYSEHVRNSGELLDIVIREKRALQSAFCSIFNDPSLRMAWKKFKTKDIGPDSMGKLLEASFILNDIQSAFLGIENLDLPAESERSAFEQNVAKFQSVGSHTINSLEKLKIYFDLFSEIKVLRGESGKKKTPSHEQAKDSLDKLREWIRAWYPMILDYQDAFVVKILPWVHICLDLFNYIEARLNPNDGLTFGDIEYYVALGLGDNESRTRVNKQYRYFIVDEFQDTSALQFSIIKELINNQFERLFCVGDAKQAIYGFRGGELSVFKDCQEFVPKVLTLSNNYRSLEKVIEFNNSLFKSLLPSGQGFVGHDAFSVNSEDQTVPLDKDEKGEIKILTVASSNESDEEKISSDMINNREAAVIAEEIEFDRRNNPNCVSTILYRKLKPSGDLIRHLIKKDIGFTAQYKIDLLDDPIVGMFLVLLRRQFDQKEKSKSSYPKLMLQSYFDILKIDQVVNENDLADFDLDTKYWGLFEAFKKFIFKLNITNENSDLNFDTIQTLCKLHHQDQEKIMVHLGQGDDDKIGLEFRFGKNAHLVQLMSAHASKGLEFDHVYLAGIYTNGRDNPDRDMFGDLPGSFYWYKDIAKKDRQKSPLYIYESELNRYKNFSEAKRLFYVACTRAKSKLVWVDFSGVDEIFSIPKNSWIQGLRFWMNDVRGAAFNSHLLRSSASLPLEMKLVEEQSKPFLPLFFYDSVGVVAKDHGHADLAFSGELSVTRLNALIDCPRKFYLLNTLKLTPGDSDKKFDNLVRNQEEDLQIVSSSQRGSRVHALLSQAVEHNFIVPLEAFNTELKAPLEWALSELTQFKMTHDFFSEKPLKFKFFNFMVSGIPDLILISKNLDQTSQVWDYKTGRMTQEKLSHYWIQLKAYAYSLYQLEKVSRESEIEIKLCFVDEKRMLSQTVKLSQIEAELFELWETQSRPWLIKADHCSQCFYNDICNS